MFYKMIANKCEEWYNSEQCTVRNLIEYIEKTGQMRDAQIEAIKVYLFLKIACECKSLEFLFRYGYFNSIDLNDIELSTTTREYLEENSAAAALFEYSRLKNDKDEQVSETLEKQIKKDASSIDCDSFFRNAFYKICIMTPLPMIFLRKLISLATSTITRQSPSGKKNLLIMFIKKPSFWIWKLTPT